MSKLDNYNKKILFLFITSLATIIIATIFLGSSLKAQETPLTKKEFLEHMEADFNDLHIAGSVALVKNGKIHLLRTA